MLSSSEKATLTEACRRYSDSRSEACSAYLSARGIPEAVANTFRHEDCISRFTSRIAVNGECWEWTGGLYRHGYGAFHAHGETYYAHRYSYTLFNDGVPPLNQVCHTCDNRRCVNPAHLWDGTQKQNMDDCAAKGRKFPPPTNSKLAPDDVRAVRAEFVHSADGSTNRRFLAEKYGVSASLITEIIGGRQRADVK